jgi:hypothetical protein
MPPIAYNTTIQLGSRAQNSAPASSSMTSAASTTLRRHTARHSVTTIPP